MAGKKITARDIADRLGVSISTVGRAMADDPRISAATKRAVREVANEIGYVGNRAARMMRGERSNLIGLVVPDIENDFYTSIAQTLSKCCERQGYQIVLSVTNDDPDCELQHLRDLVETKAAGIILVPSGSPRRECRDVLANTPHVQLLRHVPLLGDAWFGIDDEAALHEATAYLIGQGHRRIAYIGEADCHSTGSAHARGVRRACAEAGIDPADLRCLLGSPAMAFAEEAVTTLLAQGNPPTALLAGSVHHTLGMLKALIARRAAIPRAFSLIGFGDPLWFAWWGDGLTTISPPLETLARTCGLWFIDQLNAEPGGFSPARIQVNQSRLILRGSVAGP